MLMFASFLSHRLGPLKSTRHEDLYKYEFEFKAKTDNIYTITPLSNILLFSPASLKVLGVNDCQDDIATFVGDLGKVSAVIVRLKCSNAFAQIPRHDRGTCYHLHLAAYRTDNCW